MDYLGWTLMWFGSASGSRRNLEKSVILPMVVVWDAEELVMTMEMSKIIELGEIGENGKENEEMRTFSIFSSKIISSYPNDFPLFCTTILTKHNRNGYTPYSLNLSGFLISLLTLPLAIEISHVLLSESLFSHVPLCSPKPAFWPLLISIFPPSTSTLSSRLNLG